MIRTRPLLRDARGVSTIEFALVMPLILMTVMGLSEIAYEAYVKSILNGAIQKAARDSTIQGNGSDIQTAALDQKVKDIVKLVVPKATFTSTRSNFDNYSSIAGEPFIDSKWPNPTTGTYDGICNHGESYTDVNANGKYDLDLSATGQGGANDVTKYTMSVTYQRLFPVGFFTWGDTVTLASSTILKNQPFATQSVNSGTTTGELPVSALAAKLRRLRTATSGAAVVEFALAFPVFLTMGGYGTELSSFAYANLQVSQYALALADNASRIGVNNGQQTYQLREGDLNDILQGARIMASTLQLTTYGRVTLTSLENVQQDFSDGTDDTAPVQRIHWQRCIGKRGGTSDPGYDTSYGAATPLTTAGTDTTYANRGVTVTGFGAAPIVTAPAGSGVMFVEINYEYQPLFGTMFMTKRKIHSVAALIVRDRREFGHIYNPKTALGTTPVPSTCDLHNA